MSEWIRVTVEPEMAIEWDAISALDGIDEMRLFLDSPDGFGEKNYHVAGGNTRFIEALAARLTPSQIMTSARVTAIEQDDSGVKLGCSEGLPLRRHHGQDGGGHGAGQHARQHPVLAAAQRQEVAGYQHHQMGSYIKVHFRVSHEASKLWQVDGENVLTLLSDTQAGSIYDVTDLHRPIRQPRDQVLTLLLHARFARELVNQPFDDVRETSAAALDALFPGVGRHITSAEIFVYPHAVAYWPLSSGARASTTSPNELRRPKAGSTSAATRPRTVTRKEPSSPHCEWHGRSSNVAPS